MTLKRRVMLALIALVALFTLVQGGLAVWSMHEQEDDLVDDLVMTEARRLAQRIESSGPSVLGADSPVLLPDHYEAWWLSPQGQALPAALPPELAKLANGPHRDQATDSEYHIVVMPVAEGRLFMRYDAERNEDKVHDFALEVMLLALLFIALAFVIARYTASVLVAPLERVAQLMDHWAPASNTTTQAAPDEETRLLDAFRRVQTRWERGLTRESEMLADLRHEVRTPLAALRTDLEMLQETLLQTSAAAGRDQAVRQRLQRSLTSVDAVAGALESMRALEAGRGAQAEQVPLADCVDDAWASLGELPASRGLVLSNEVAASAFAQADRHALMTILRNLVRNAADHAAPGRCRVLQEGAVLVVEDDGPGIPADELPFVFERYYRGRLADAPAPSTAMPSPSGDYERGLGLAIARQVAGLQGWHLAVAPAVPRGTRFELTLTSFTAS